MKKVLIIDDAAFMRLAIRSVLEEHGFKIIGEAENGNQGIIKYRELRPDVVTMDITMPNKSGLEALKEIKELDPQAKVIMLTAMGQEDMIKESIQYGAKSFLVKPFKKEQLILTIQKILGIEELC